MTDYYKVLGVATTASGDDIKQAFRKLALTYHPDRHAGATESHRAEAANRFKLITEAYEVLSDDQKRSAYQGRGGYSSASSSSSSSYHHNVNTDWSSYRNQYHPNNGRVRISFWQALSRGVGARRLELAVAVGFTTFASILAFSIDDFWAHRNHGKHFKDIKTNLVESQKESLRAGVVKSYTPAGCSTATTTGRHAQLVFHHNGQELSPADMPLSALIAQEEALALQQQQQTDAPSPPQHGSSAHREGHSSTSSTSAEGREDSPHAAGSLSQQLTSGSSQVPWHRDVSGSASGTPASGLGPAAASSKAGGASGASMYVDKAVVIPSPSPPGQMAGHAKGA